MRPPRRRPIRSGTPRTARASCRDNSSRRTGPTSITLKLHRSRSVRVLTPRRFGAIFGFRGAYPVTMTGRAVLAAMVVSATAAFEIACGSPTAPGNAPSTLRILADPIITLATDERRSVSLQEVDSSGHIVTRESDSYSWTSSDPNVVRVESGGVLHALQAYGAAAVNVRSPARPAATARIWVQLPPTAASAYRITL